MTPAPDADGWIEWSGGECPLPRMVEVVFRDGTKTKRAIQNILGDEDWAHYTTDPDGDIIAYRIVEPRP